MAGHEVTLHQLAHEEMEEMLEEIEAGGGAEVKKKLDDPEWWVNRLISDRSVTTGEPIQGRPLI